jgi:hypothetical protein
MFSIEETLLREKIFYFIEENISNTLENDKLVSPNTSSCSVSFKSRISVQKCKIENGEVE